ncbi:hypothetical protein QCD70_07090 [Agreia sp. PsM10]|uniref:hypothetical protein n=1 Tax=Agreia sp. PsM10 TaxID=3030533 RepID=UPI00263B6105|nr:hypothetical protein [Agreia sp. PsM10]MDN4640003.1 hypothetical protein [Agreia sp. PsM10]
MTDANIATFPPLVVGTDPEAVRKAFRLPLAFVAGFIVVIAFVAVLVTAMMASLSGFGSGVLAALPFLITLSYMVYLAVRTAQTAGERASAGTVLTIDAAGLNATIPQGVLVLPWQAIESVALQKRGRHRIAIFRTVHGVTPDSPGIQTTIKPGIFRLLAKKGFRIGSAGIDVPVQTVLDATAAFTGGRLVAR